MRSLLLCQKLILTVALLIGFGGYALANCGKIQAVVGTANGYAQKCYAAICSGTPPTYYLTEKYTTSGSSGTQTIGYDGQDNAFGSYWTTSTSTTSWPGCSSAVTYSGQATYKFIETTNGVLSVPPSVSYDGTLSATDVWSDYQAEAYSDASALGVTTTNMPGIEECALIVTEQRGLEVDGDSESKQIEILTHPCTDAMLRSEILKQVNNNQLTWVTNAPYVKSFGSAAYTLDADHFYGSGSTMKYFFHITDCQPHLTYKVTWNQITSIPGSAAPIKSQKMTEEITGSGDPVAGVNTKPITVDMPSTPSIISEEDVKMVVVPQD